MIFFLPFPLEQPSDIPIEVMASAASCHNVLCELVPLPFVSTRFQICPLIGIVEFSFLSFLHSCYPRPKGISLLWRVTSNTHFRYLLSFTSLFHILPHIHEDDYSKKLLVFN